MDGGVDALKLGEHDVLAYLRPDTLVGALVYLALFLFMGLVLSRLLRAAVHAAMTREGRIDRGGIGFVQQLGTALIWVMIVILYAHLIPVLRALGTAMLAGAGVASVVIGLAAQSTLGNLVAGISITIYRPFRLGDTLQVTTPTGTEIGVVQWISLGYTTLGTADGRLVVLPNSVVANQVNLNLNKTYPLWDRSAALWIWLMGLPVSRRLAEIALSVRWDQSLMLEAALLAGAIVLVMMSAGRLTPEKAP